ncbi:peroxisome proliferator-activated receptor gamma coactivator-related protein 1 isoform X2 [Denticeps clupeoides]|uniref:peroxisome proliferator-activated receptor gamma coactivator-related protein 1 isoform X2 n=1 Tax=Denticeps clupeoides TaxID=299321 RepID=UPI0010A416E4|nr:peroxisome proliferator-activated receptor gamma coactivator-related protein 1-like isoform X2 [Denticeps clupeoides]
MAARWGTGEKVLIDCGIMFLPPIGLDESQPLEQALCNSTMEEQVLGSSDSLDALNMPLESSILSIFDDCPTGEVKMGIDEESEATLLSALTEMLDNVDNESISPFDILPDSDLFSGNKAYEHSTLRKLLCQSPPKKDPICHTRVSNSPKKIQSTTLQRIDREDEEPLTIISEIEPIPLDWSSLPLSLVFSFEEEAGKQMLSEGGILLEVVDQGENGEPILTIPELGFPVPLAECDTTESDLSVPVKNERPGHLAPLPAMSSVNVGGREKNAVIICPKKDSKKKVCPKRKLRNQVFPSAPLNERRILRSYSLRKTPLCRPLQKAQDKLKKKKVTFSPCVSVMPTEATEPRSQNLHKEQSISALPGEPRQNVLETSAVPVPTPIRIPRSVPATSFLEAEGISLPSSKVTAWPSSDCKQHSRTVCSLDPVSSEPDLKPKHLSLQEYRLFRQQKKLAPVAKTKDIRTKWPTLPEPPRDLLPIPCLHDLNTRDPRQRSSALQVCKNPERIVWLHNGPGAPPTPEALLVPPASMATSSINMAIPNALQPLKSCRVVPSEPQTQSAASQDTMHTGLTSITQPLEPVFNNSSLPSTTVLSSHQQTQGCSAQLSAAKLKLQAEFQFEKVHLNETATKVATPITVPVQEVPEVVSEIHLSARSTLPKLTTSNTSKCSPGAFPTSNGKPAQRLAVKTVQLVGQKLVAQTRVSSEQKKTEDFIHSVTNEIGIEAADLTSLLEQFEETQAKEECSSAEDCGRAVAVGNCSVDAARDYKVREGARIYELGSSAGLTPPATPPHQMWKPLIPAVLHESKLTVPVKVIQMTTVSPFSFQPFSLDHDYCIPPKESVEQQPEITAQATELTLCEGPSLETSSAPLSTVILRDAVLESLDDRTLSSSLMETPVSSPCRLEGDDLDGQPRKLLHSPCPDRFKRGRVRRRFQIRSHGSRSSSSESSSPSSSTSYSRSRSRSVSPPTKRYRSSHTRSSSSSSRSRSPPQQRRYLYSSSKSASWSHSRSWSSSCSRFSSAQRPWYSYKGYSPQSIYHTQCGDRNEESKRQKEKAIEERRIVYVGRIQGSMTRKELRERFSLFGEIEACTLHFREHGDNYGFITYYNTEDAFAAIENGSKLRQPNELPFDLCFGGRRQFCKTSYADLDSSREYDPAPAKGKYESLDFDSLLKEAKKKLKR